jgi:hypothetical protein
MGGGGKSTLQGRMPNESRGQCYKTFCHRKLLTFQVNAIILYGSYCFITLAIGACTIKLFTAVIYGFL